MPIIAPANFIIVQPIAHTTPRSDNRFEVLYEGSDEYRSKVISVGSAVKDIQVGDTVLHLHGGTKRIVQRQPELISIMAETVYAVFRDTGGQGGNDQGSDIQNEQQLGESNDAPRDENSN